MIKVTVGNNLHRVNDVIPAETTLRTALESHDIDYSVGMIHLDGATLSPGDLDKTFADFGITKSCYLIVVVKMDNA